MKSPETVLEFWFGDLGNAIPDRALTKKWFMSPDGTDELIREKFGDLHAQAARGELDAWLETPRGRLAAIILIDQFSRNIHRGSSEAFANDHLALAWCKQGIELGHDRKLTLAERGFFYLPLEHAESREDQAQCVACYQSMVDVLEGEEKAYAENLVQYAVEHQVIVDQFGRFPHRNKVLGRENTEAEDAYLLDGGQRFGQ